MIAKRCRTWLIAALLTLPVVFAATAAAAPASDVRMQPDSDSAADSCGEADFAESRKLVGPLGDFIELRRTTVDRTIQIVIHEDPDRGLRALARQIAPPLTGGTEPEVWTSSDLNIPDDILAGIWKQSGEIVVAVWPTPASGAVRFQLYSSTMMNSTCFEWRESGESQSGESAISSFANRIAVLFFPPGAEK